MNLQQQQSLRPSAPLLTCVVQLADGSQVRSPLDAQHRVNLDCLDPHALGLEQQLLRQTDTTTHSHTTTTNPTATSTPTPPSNSTPPQRIRIGRDAVTPARSDSDYPLSPDTLYLLITPAAVPTPAHASLATTQHTQHTTTQHDAQTCNCTRDIEERLKSLLQREMASLYELLSVSPPPTTTTTTTTPTTTTTTAATTTKSQAVPSPQQPHTKLHTTKKTSRCRHRWRHRQSRRRPRQHNHSPAPSPSPPPPSLPAPPPRHTPVHSCEQHQRLTINTPQHNTHSTNTSSNNNRHQP
eukprot:TRINITY_DN2153_c3_g2_i1.p1 TRINITY_DN2153_c3_g2~~TRINITY_DN2153_c3_g2_i1.p1  ORF type:complete len:296 (-),score=101.60 TRINITY_DN2153_c3_g2_i1:838-1725(-)